MSRYLKAVPASGAYTIKKVFSSAGASTQAFPSTTSVAKVMVFGGGGCACAGYLYNPSCYCCGCLCYACIMHNSGAGGGFTEKLFSGVAGLTACIVVGDVQGTSSVCIPGLGTISATGGTSTCLNAGDGSLPRCTTGGAGSGGDVNKCGSLGGCRITSINCNCCCGGCFNATGFVAVPGGGPGNTVANGVAPTLTTNTTMCCQFCCRYSNPSPYGTTTCNCCNMAVCVFCDLPRGYGGCPLETDKFYAYDWDVVGGGRCETAGSPTSSALTSTAAAGNCCGTNGQMTYRCLNFTIATPAAYVPGVAGGLTGSGGAGGVGGVGGGGGGVYTTCATINCISSVNCTLGGIGLVVVYF